MRQKNTARKGNKRATVFHVMMVVGTFLALTFAYAELQYKRNQLSRVIGERQYEVLSTYEDAEKALAYIDTSGRYSAEKSIHSLGDRGGYYKGSECGTSPNGFVNWESHGKTCYPTNETLELSYSKYYSTNMELYLKSYPTKRVEMPEDFTTKLDNKLMIRAKGDTPIVVYSEDQFTETTDQNTLCGKTVNVEEMKKYVETWKKASPGSGECVDTGHGKRCRLGAFNCANFVSHMLFNLGVIESEDVTYLVGELITTVNKKYGGPDKGDDVVHWHKASPSQTADWIISDDVPKNSFISINRVSNPTATTQGGSGEHAMLAYKDSEGKAWFMEHGGPGIYLSEIDVLRTRYGGGTTLYSWVMDFSSLGECGEQPSTGITQTNTELEKQIKEVIQKSGFDIGVAMNRGAEGIQINADEIYYSASTIKAALAIIYIKKGGDMNSADLQSMILASNNEAGNRIIEKIGGITEINKELQKMGLTKSHMGRKFLDPTAKDDNYLTPNDAITIFKIINEGTYLTKEQNTKLLQLLKSTNQDTPPRFDEIAGTTNVANKWGECPADREGCSNDAGIIYKNDGTKIYLSVLVKGGKAGDQTRRVQAIRDIAKLVYETQPLTIEEQKKTENKALLNLIVEELGDRDSGITDPGSQAAIKPVALQINRIIQSGSIPGSNIESFNLLEEPTPEQSLAKWLKTKKQEEMPPTILLYLQTATSSDQSENGAAAYVYCECRPGVTLDGTCELKDCIDNSLLPQNKKIAEGILKNLIGVISINDKKIIGTNNPLLKLSPFPAVIIQLGYLSNKENQEVLLNGDGQEKLTKAILDSIIKIQTPVQSTIKAATQCKNIDFSLISQSGAAQCEPQIRTMQKYYEEYKLGEYEIDPLIPYAIAVVGSTCTPDANCEGIMNTFYPCGITTEPDYCRCKMDTEFAINKGNEFLKANIEEMRKKGLKGDEAITLALFGYDRGIFVAQSAAEMYLQGKPLNQAMIDSCMNTYNSKQVCDEPGIGARYPEKIFAERKNLCQELEGKITQQLPNTTYKDADFKYVIKAATKTEFKHDLLGTYSYLTKKSQKVKSTVRACLAAGSGMAGDDDVATCAEQVGANGVDKPGEYYLEFTDEKPIRAAPTYGTGDSACTGFSADKTNLPPERFMQAYEDYDETVDEYAELYLPASLDKGSFKALIAAVMTKESSVGLDNNCKANAGKSALTGCGWPPNCARGCGCSGKWVWSDELQIECTALTLQKHIDQPQGPYQVCQGYSGEEQLRCIFDVYNSGEYPNAFGSDYGENMLAVWEMWKNDLCTEADSTKTNAATSASGTECEGTTGRAIVVYGENYELDLCENGIAQKTYQIGIGKGGMGKTSQGDDKTPTGEYKIKWKASVYSETDGGNKITTGNSYCGTGSEYYTTSPPGYTSESLWENGYGGSEAVVMGLDYPNSNDLVKGYSGGCIEIHATQLGGLGEKSSAGCIRMKPAEARELYKSIEVGTPVIIKEKKKVVSTVSAFDTKSPSTTTGGSATTGQERYTEEEMEKIFGRCNNAELAPVEFMGKKVMVNKKTVEAFQAVNTEIKAMGVTYNFWRDPAGGTYNCRKNTNDQSKWSTHAYGVAIDINPDTNPNAARIEGKKCITDLPQPVIDAFKKNGFCWGGDFTHTCDTMHFEYCKNSGTTNIGTSTGTSAGALNPTEENTLRPALPFTIYPLFYGDLVTISYALQADDDIPPPATTGLKVSEASRSIDSITVQVNWNENYASDTQNYHVTSSEGSSVNTGATGWTINSYAWEEGTTYTFTITATDEVGNTGVASETTWKAPNKVCCQDKDRNERRQWECGGGYPYGC